MEHKTLEEQAKINAEKKKKLEEERIAANKRVLRAYRIKK